MEFFFTYLQLGLQHILDWQAMDHLLFIVSFTVLYTFANLKQSLLLVTAFTLGHSLTLALATLQLVEVPAAWVEFLIPVTICLSALKNLNFEYILPSKRNTDWKSYALIAGFGLVHGLGFSNYLQSLLGKEQNIFLPLLAFNLGLELAQLLVVILLLLLISILVNGLKVHQKSIVILGSGIIIGNVLPMLWDRWPF